MRDSPSNNERTRLLRAPAALLVAGLALTGCGIGNSGHADSPANIINEGPVSNPDNPGQPGQDIDSPSPIDLPSFSIKPSEENSAIFDKAFDVSNAGADAIETAERAAELSTYIQKSMEDIGAMTDGELAQYITDQVEIQSGIIKQAGMVELPDTFYRLNESFNSPYDTHDLTEYHDLIKQMLQGYGIVVSSDWKQEDIYPPDWPTGVQAKPINRELNEGEVNNYKLNILDICAALSSSFTEDELKEIGPHVEIYFGDLSDAGLTNAAYGGLQTAEVLVSSEVNGEKRAVIVIDPLRGQSGKDIMQELAHFEQDSASGSLSDIAFNRLYPAGFHPSQEAYESLKTQLNDQIWPSGATYEAPVYTSSDGVTVTTLECLDGGAFTRPEGADIASPTNLGIFSPEEGIAEIYRTLRSPQLDGVLRGAIHQLSGKETLFLLYGYVLAQYGSLGNEARLALGMLNISTAMAADAAESRIRTIAPDTEPTPDQKSLIQALNGLQ